MKLSEEIKTAPGTALHPEISMFIPWTTREGFTENICGLPGNERGCWRYRVTEGNPCFEGREEERGIAPRSLDSAKDEAW